MTVHESLIDAIGGTPLIRLNRVVGNLAPAIYVKPEFYNPGGSVKDRAALSMVQAAEAAGLLGPGGTIFEGTSGNTGIGLAIVAAQRGYGCTVVVPDKTSVEKISILRAYGAEVIVTVGGLPREHPDHVENVVRRLADEKPGGWFANQYDNPANPQAHWQTTGPEVWEQTNGRITHFVAGIGTGGTISGTGGYLKQVSEGAVRVIGADPETSVYAGGDGSPYYVEAIGHYLHPDTVDDLWPQSYDQKITDELIRVSDRESLLTTRRLAREEGILAGASAGTAVAAALRLAATLGPDDLTVVILPDSGRAYLSKYFDDSWLRRCGFLEDEVGGPTVRDVLTRTVGPQWAPPRAVFASSSAGEVLSLVDSDAADLLTVVLPRSSAAETWAPGDVIGTARVSALRDAPADAAVGDHMTAPLPQVGVGEQAAEALERVEDAALILVDGRVATVATRTHLTT